MATAPNNQTVLAVAIAVAAMIGAASGALSAAVVSGALRGSTVLGNVWLFGEAPTPLEVDRKLVDLIEEESATIAVVERVTPAVVSVVIKKQRKDMVVGLFDGADTTELVEVGGGTGFFATQDGLIITNRHVVSDPTAVYSVITNDGVELPAQVVDSDPFLDIAILDVEGDGYPTVVLGDSDRIRIGATVIAIGNTLSEFRNTVTKGVVSGINRRITAGDAFGSGEIIERAIQTDAAINPGNSGGPLINLLGEAVGVNTAMSAEGQSLGFAIPVNEVKKAVTDVEAYGRIVRPWLGVRYAMLTEQTAREAGLPFAHGALVVNGGPSGSPGVIEGSPADEAGLREGDVILSVGGTELSEEHTLGAAISGYRPGDQVTFKIVRGEEVFERQVTLAEFDTERIP